MVENIRAKLVEMDDQPEEIEEEIRQKNPEVLEDEEIMAYFHSKDKLYEISNYKEQPPYNKEFLRENVLTTNNTRSPFLYDWKINLLTSNPPMDLMLEVNPIVASLRNSKYREVFTVSYLSDVIKYLRKKGIKKIILIDFTCSVIRNKIYGVTSRAERYLAFLHSRNKWFKTMSKRGGKKRKIRNIRKTRKNFRIK
jgi:hypothetical protein